MKKNEECKSIGINPHRSQDLLWHTRQKKEGDNFNVGDIYHCVKKKNKINHRNKLRPYGSFTIYLFSSVLKTDGQRPHSLPEQPVPMLGCLQGWEVYPFIHLEHALFHFMGTVSHSSAHKKELDSVLLTTFSHLYMYTPLRWTNPVLSASPHGECASNPCHPSTVYLHRGAQGWAQYSICGVMNSEQKGIIAPSSLADHTPVHKAQGALVYLCCLGLSSLPIRPQNLSLRAAPSLSVPSLCHCRGSSVPGTAPGTCSCSI